MHVWWAATLGVLTACVPDAGPDDVDPHDDHGDDAHAEGDCDDASSGVGTDPCDTGADTAGTGVVGDSGSLNGGKARGVSSKRPV